MSDKYTSLPFQNSVDPTPPPSRGGLLADIIDLYTAARKPETTLPESNAPSRMTSLESLPDNMFRKRTLSVMSTNSDFGGVDDEDPQISGAKKNTIDDEKSRLSVIAKSSIDEDEKYQLQLQNNIKRAC